MEEKQCILEGEHRKGPCSRASSSSSVDGGAGDSERWREGENANEDEDGCSVGVLERLLDDGILRGDVLSTEVLLRVLGQPQGELGQLLAQALGSLEVHVGLSKQLGEKA